MDKSGAWFSFAGERIGQGRENAKQFLRENADIKNRIEVDVRKVLNLPLPLEAAVPAEAVVAAKGKK